MTVVLIVRPNLWYLRLFWITLHNSFALSLAFISYSWPLPHRIFDMRGNKAVHRLTKPKLLSSLAKGATAGTMDKLFKILVAQSFLLTGCCRAGKT